MTFYTYVTLNNQCKPQTCAISSNHKFLTDDIKSLGVYPRASLDQTSSSTMNVKKGGNNKLCELNKNGICKDDPKKVWGNSLWTYMHYAAMNYPDHPTEKDISEMINWLVTLPVTIPCNNCKGHYRGYIEKAKSQLHTACSDKDSLFKFLVDIHNKVNVRLGKPEVSYEDAYKLYENNSECTNCGK